MAIHNLGVVGLGYVGQPLVAALASVGYNVLGMDIDEDRVAVLRTYQPTLYEPGLTETLARCRDRIRFTRDYEELMNHSEAVCITVWTPVNDGSGPDIAAVEDVVADLGAHLRGGQTIILRSTVIPGTTSRMAAMLERISGLRAGREFFVSFCPERTIEGIALYELYNLPTIVGGINAESTRRTVEIFRRLTPKVIPVSSPTVAELCKLADNMYRALNIAFANEFGDVCESSGVDGYEVVQVVNSAYPRTNLFRPGLGSGGPCLSKDPLILRHHAESLGVRTPLIEIAAQAAFAPVARIVREIQTFVAKHRLFESQVALMGLAFKGMPETDDVRGSAARMIFDALSEASAQEGNQKRTRFVAFDPIVRDFRGLPVASRLEDALQGSHVILFLNDHPSLLNIPMSVILEHATRPLIVIDVWHNVQNVERDRIPPGVTYIRIGDGS